jgi:hypothetical protein
LLRLSIDHCFHMGIHKGHWRGCNHICMCHQLCCSLYLAPATREPIWAHFTFEKPMFQKIRIKPTISFHNGSMTDQ